MTNKELVMNFFTDGYVNHNYLKILEYLSKDYVDHSPAKAKGNIEAAGILKCVEDMFSNMEIKVLDLIEEDNKVVIRLSYTGIHTGTCMNIAPTNKKITFEGIEIFRIENKQIVESWGYWPDKEIEKLLLEK